MARTTYRFIDGEFVEVTKAAPARVDAPYVQGDLPAYRSPITGREVDGRSARREDLARSGCREVDPSEFKTARLGRME